MDTMPTWNSLTYNEKCEALQIAYSWYHSKNYFGSQAQIPTLLTLINEYRLTSVLDYGCGSGHKKIWESLKAMCPSLKTYRPYDPYSKQPEIRNYPPAGSRFDLVSCTDVLEHLLIEDLEDVLTDLLFCTNKMLYLTICLSHAGKMVVDANGEDLYNQSLHTIVKPKDWWLAQIAKAERTVRDKQARSIPIKILWT